MKEIKYLKDLRSIFKWALQLNNNKVIKYWIIEFDMEFKDWMSNLIVQGISKLVTMFTHLSNLKFLFNQLDEL